MRVPHTDFELTYCLNVHPGEGLEEIHRAVTDYVLPLKARVSPEAAFGLGLRLANRAAHELLKGDALARFRDFLQENELYALTVNGFPYGEFHAAPVKQAVYEPDWTSDERADYSFRLARIMAGLLPEGGGGSISTCPLAYALPERDDSQREELLDVCANRLRELARRLNRLHEETGRLITVDLEPEPDGLLENSGQAIDFFERLTGEEARRHLGICYDTCHFAVLSESPADALGGLENAGIQIGKIQLSSALAIRVGEDGAIAADALASFADSVYLHQTAGRRADGSRLRFEDLDVALPSIRRETDIEWRTHFHVPVFLESYGALGSTRDEMLASLRIAREKKITRVLEIETYTWDVLPGDLKGDLTASLAREFEFILGALRPLETKSG